MSSLKSILNALIAHRRHKVLLCHSSLLDFLARAACSHPLWMPSLVTRDKLHADALKNWYD